jgi:beta-glucosidase
MQEHEVCHLINRRVLVRSNEANRLPLQPGLLHKTQAKESFSEPFYPSPWMNPHAEGWEAAYQKAHGFVSQLTILEKINLTTGVG